MANRDDDMKQLNGMGFPMAQSVLTAVYDANKGDVNHTIDELLTMASDPMQEERNLQNNARAAHEQEEADRQRQIAENKAANALRLQREADMLKEQDEELKFFQVQKDLNKEEEALLIAQAQRLAEDERIAEEERKKNMVEEQHKKKEAELQRRRREEEERMIAEQDIAKANQVLEEKKKTLAMAREQLRQEEEALEEEKERIAAKKAANDVSSPAPAPAPSDDSNVAISPPVSPSLDGFAGLDIAQSFVESHPPKMPRACIYVREDMAEPERVNVDIEKAKTLLVGKGLTRAEIRDMNMTHDFEITGALREKCGGKLTFPIIFVRDTLIGDLDDLNAWEKDGRLDRLLFSADNSATDTSPLQIGVLDKTLNVTEYILSGVGTVLLLPVTILTWPFRSGPPEVVKDEGDLDFDIIHTNWYWRHQRRVLRFKKEAFVRIHPGCGDVRAVHPYDCVDRITLCEEEELTDIIINYKDGYSPDYVRAPAEDIQKILHEFHSRTSVPLKVVKYADDEANQN